MADGRKTGGRKAGVPNKATADLKKLAQVYTPAALKTLSSIMHDSESDPARVSAAKELLDRAHGKATQPIAGADGGGLLVRIIQVAEVE